MAFASDYKRDLITALDTVDLDRVEELIEVFRKARAEDRQIFVFGNGGSAAIASRIRTLVLPTSTTMAPGFRLGPMAPTCRMAARTGAASTTISAPATPDSKRFVP